MVKKNSGWKKATCASKDGTKKRSAEMVGVKSKEDWKAGGINE